MRLLWKPAPYSFSSYLYYNVGKMQGKQRLLLQISQKLLKPRLLMDSAAWAFKNGAPPGTLHRQRHPPCRRRAPVSMSSFPGIGTPPAPLRRPRRPDSPIPAGTKKRDLNQRPLLFYGIEGIWGISSEQGYLPRTPGCIPPPPIIPPPPLEVTVELSVSVSDWEPAVRV